MTMLNPLALRKTKIAINLAFLRTIGLNQNANESQKYHLTFTIALSLSYCVIL